MHITHYNMHIIANLLQTSNHVLVPHDLWVTYYLRKKIQKLQKRAQFGNLTQYMFRVMSKLCVVVNNLYVAILCKVTLSCCWVL